LNSCVHPSSKDLCFIGWPLKLKIQHKKRRNALE